MSKTAKAVFIAGRCAAGLVRTAAIIEENRESVKAMLNTRWSHLDTRCSLTDLALIYFRPDMKPLLKEGVDLRDKYARAFVSLLDKALVRKLCKHACGSRPALMEYDA